jgi:uncharacterized phage-associated protein
MMRKFLDIDKTIEVMLYISNSTQDLFHIMKILYFADKFHLEGYGRLITGDNYIAMKDGPVPSGAYDLIKHVRGDGFLVPGVEPELAFIVEGRTTVAPIREVNLEYLSESDIECLNKAIESFANMSFPELWRVAHDEESYKNADFNNDISMTSIVQSLENGNEIFEYLNS